MPDQKRRRRDESAERSGGRTTVRRRGSGRDDWRDDPPQADERPERPRGRRQGPGDDGRQPRKPRGRDDQGRQQRRSRGPGDRSSDHSRPRRARARGPTGAELAQRARRELADITGLDTESVTSLGQAGDGTWRLTVEALELARIPESDDVLGSYEVQLDEDGELLGYERVERYARSQSGRQDRRGS